MQRKRHDAATKLLFVREVVADMVRALHPEAAAALRLDEMEPLSTEYVSMNRTKRIGDAAYKVPYKDGDRYALVTVEFQSGEDAAIDERVDEYVLEMLRDYRHRGIVRPGERPVVLPFVVYIGLRPRRRPKRREAPAADPDPLAAVGGWEYIEADLTDGPRPEWPEDSRLAAAARLADGPPEELAARLGAEFARYPGAEDLELRRGMHAWADEALLGLDIDLPPFEEMDGATEERMEYLYKKEVEKWRADSFAEGRTEGRAEGMVAGQCELLEGMASHRFGPAAAQRLSETVNGTPSKRLMADVGTLIVACQTEDEFTEALRRLDRN